MKIICVEEHAIDPATDKAARSAVLGEAPYFGLMDSPDAASTPRNDHRPTMVALPEALELAADIGDGRIKHMDEQGIQMQVVSYGSLAQLAPAAQAVALTQAANNRLAEAIAANPARLSGFAVLPWQDPKAAAAELDRSVTQLGLKGVLLLGRPGARFLDDPAYVPVLEKLNDLNVPLYAHPGIPLPDVQHAYYSGFPAEVTAQFSLTGWGWHHEAGIHVLRLILSGVFEKYPGLQVISGHWGEMVPFYLQRLDDMLPPNLTGLTDHHRGLPEPCVGHPQRPVRPSPLPVHPHRHRRRPHHLVGRLPVPHAGRRQGIPRETPGQRTRPGKDRALERRETVHAVR